MASSDDLTVSRSIKAVLLMFLVSAVCAVGWYKLRGSTLVGVPRLPFYCAEDFTAEWIAPTDPRYPKIHRIARFSLLNQQGDLVTNGTLAGKIYVANFFFTSCPGICPKMATNFLRVQTAFANDDDVRLVSHSVMPDSDTPEVLRTYAAEHGVVAGKWHLLTGDKQSIYTLARRSYFAEKLLGFRKDTSEFLHTENMMLIDRHGRIRGIYNATLPVDADRAIDDIRLLQREP